MCIIFLILIKNFLCIKNKRDLHDPDNHDGIITHLEPDMLESKIKRALGSITMNKASGGDGIPTELFQILRDTIQGLNLCLRQADSLPLSHPSVPNQILETKLLQICRVPTPWSFLLFSTLPYTL